MTSDSTTAISNDALKDLCKWVRTIKCTNCGEIMMGLDKDLENSGYKRFYEGLLQSASMVSIETHGII